MDDSPVQETNNVTINNTNDNEIDPLDAYMLEIDEQVQQLDKKDQEEAEKLRNEKLAQEATALSEEANYPSILGDENEEEDEEVVGKAGNFSTVEELIA